MATGLFRHWSVLVGRGVRKGTKPGGHSDGGEAAKSIGRLIFLPSRALGRSNGSDLRGFRGSFGSGKIETRYCTRLYNTIQYKKIRHRPPNENWRELEEK